MKNICWGRSVWGIDSANYGSYFAELKSKGYESIEVGTPDTCEEARTLRALAADSGLKVIAQIWTDGDTVEQHFESAKRQLDVAFELNPQLINSHTGKDYFPVNENAWLIEQMDNYVAGRASLVHETHRGRATYAAHVTNELLEKVPSMRLCLDISHWCCVHESLLEDQAEAVQLAITRSDYVHTRVGTTQTPQEDDWLDKSFEPDRQQFREWWKTWIDHRISQGEDLMMTLEWGPFPYAHKKSLADSEEYLARKNDEAKQWLSENL